MIISEYLKGFCVTHTNDGEEVLHFCIRLFFLWTGTFSKACLLDGPGRDCNQDVPEWSSDKNCP